MSKGNSKDFCSIIHGHAERDIENYGLLSKDRILTSRYYDGNFVADYRRPIEHYLKACGCKILSTNNNWWDNRFYVYHTVPTRVVNPMVWFEEDYKDGIYWSNNKKAIVGLSIFTIIVCSFIILIKMLFG